MKKKGVGWTKDMWAFSGLSDAQALIEMGRYEEANQKINDVKRVLKGKYKEAEGGFSIEIHRGRLA